MKSGRTGWRPVSLTDNLVVTDGGKGFLLLGVQSDTITTEEGKKLESED